MSDPAAMSDPATTARRHFFNRSPHAYRDARPPYPARVYEILTAECGLGAGSRVLELGPGTGQATSELLARGADVVAVEPGAGLAAVLTERCGGERLRVVVADIEHADLPPGAYDLAVSATAFHWVDPGRALPKVASLLAPGGYLAVWWTVFGDPERPTDFRRALDDIYARHLPDERRDHTPGPLRVESWSDELRRGGWFGEVSVDLIRWTQQLTVASARSLWSSFPNVGELPAPRREAFLDDLAATVGEHGGLVADPRVTAVYRARSAGA
jgi:SAM-dependent methyltransferase